MNFRNELLEMEIPKDSVSMKMLDGKKAWVQKKGNRYTYLIAGSTRWLPVGKAEVATWEKSIKEAKNKLSAKEKKEDKEAIGYNKDFEAQVKKTESLMRLAQKKIDTIKELKAKDTSMMSGAVWEDALYGAMKPLLDVLDAFDKGIKDASE